MRGSGRQRRGQTLIEQFLGGLVGIHIALLEGGIDVGIGVVLDDLLDRLDGAADASRECLSAAFDLGSSDHRKRSATSKSERANGEGGRPEGNGAGSMAEAVAEEEGRWGGRRKTLGERGGERSH